MQIVNGGIMFVTLSLGTRGDEMGNPEEWALGIGKEIAGKERATLDKGQQVAMQREIIAEKMLQIWEEILVEFQAHCHAYNEQIKPKRILTLFRESQHQFIVKPDAMADTISGQYDPHTKTIVISTVGIGEQFYPEVELRDSGSVRLVSRTTGFETSPTQIAQDALRKSLV
jgi:hypothetical protein